MQKLRMIEASMPPQDETPGLRTLWKQFLPLSVSDVTMAFGDPAITATLAQLPDARVNLAALGVAKSLAVFFESPVIMILHASNALAGSVRARKALYAFTLLLMAVLSGGLLVLALPAVFGTVGEKVLGLAPELVVPARVILMFLILWPAAIAWRRYYQGLLIRAGFGNTVARAGIARMLFVIGALGLGLLFKLPGTVLAGLALIGGVFTEAVLVTRSAKAHGVEHVTREAQKPLPESLSAVWRFYWPLANSMVVVWGGRAALIAIVARAVDGPLALAVWPAAWGLVLLIANSTRMTQQVVIRNRGLVSDALLLRFAVTVGTAASAIVILLGMTTLGRQGILAFVGFDSSLFKRVVPVIILCSVVPFLVAMQNAIQGFLIEEGRTHRVNLATGLGTVTLLGSAGLLVARYSPGATAAAAAMVLGLVVETLVLAAGLRRH